MFIKQGYAFTLCRSDNKLRERAQMKTKFCVKKKITADCWYLYVIAS